MYFAQTPAIAKHLFKNIIWNIPEKEKIIYLSFDDGPTPEITEWTLECLNKFDAKATFFCIGKNIEKNPEIFQKIIAGNHSIGNHTYNHLNGWKTSAKDYMENVTKCEEAIGKWKMENGKWKMEVGRMKSEDGRRKSEVGRRKVEHGRLKIEDPLPTTHYPFFRPPYGKLTPAQYSLLHTKYSIVMWNVLSGDFDVSLPGEKCFNNVKKHIRNGSIVVFHDSEKASRNLFYALPKTLEYFSENGFRFEALQKG